MWSNMLPDNKHIYSTQLYLYSIQLKVLHSAKLKAHKQNINKLNFATLKITAINNKMLNK